MHVSGSIMNPAVSTAIQLASTVGYPDGGSLSSIWLYWAADFFGSLLAALLFLALTRCARVFLL
jgi:glycerol uptake facilitator-like aquaporin